MSQQHVEPNVISCSAAVSACEKGGRWQAALDLLGSMAQRRVELDVISCNAVVIGPHLLAGTSG
eukprot:7492275-Alexandrium_andersonii.AAC.1